MNNTIDYSATMTSKGQVTIPQKVREILEIATGDTLSFTVDGNTNSVTIKKGVTKCPICRGEKQVEKLPCFACSETGTLNPKSSVLSDIMRIQKYKVRASFIQQNFKDNIPSMRDFPLIRLYSNDYSNEHITSFQDYLQLKAICEYAGDIPVNSLRTDMLESINSEDIKKRIKKQFYPIEDIFRIFFGVEHY